MPRTLIQMPRTQNLYCYKSIAYKREKEWWWARQDSNLQPDGYEPSALTN